VQYSDTIIIIFAREPVEGQVKTRLIPALGEQTATRLYAQLLNHTIANVLNCQLSVLDICITPESQSLYFTQLPFGAHYKLSTQQGNDLGERMYYALSGKLEKFTKAILIGTDCPSLNCHELSRAIRALDYHDMVFSPAKDGGYVLVGAKQLSSVVFSKINWGSEWVMQQTRNALLKTGLSWQELSLQQDIDNVEDLVHLQLYPQFSVK